MTYRKVATFWLIRGLCNNGEKQLILNLQTFESSVAGEIAPLFRKYSVMETHYIWDVELRFKSDIFYQQSSKYN